MTKTTCHRAHLRNKKGYVYLRWREGKRVRTFYLGKAPRTSPTTAIADLAAAGARSGARGTVHQVRL